ncbi:MAG: CHRD domain-containing protein, partial [Pseudomonadota bacterium]
YDSETLELLATIETGNLPDSVSISPDGSVAVIANEGEFNSESDLTVDAPGGVTIIDLSDTANITASTVDFSGATDLIEAADLRLHPDADPANDVEPEFVAFSGDSATAYITLQENNGIAVLDLESQTFTDILSMGTLDHSQPGNGFDATDDDVIDIEPRNTLGLRQADAIVTADIDGTTYLLTANEGDGRGDGIDGDGNAVPFGDEARVGDLAEAGLLDPEAFPTTVVGENLEMSEAQEVTETPVPDTAATGSFTATFDEVAMTVTVSGTYSDLTSELFNVGGDDQFGNPESAIHVHLGDAGTNGPIFGNLTVTDNGDLSGSFTGTFDVTEEQAETFRNDGYYVNLHTANFNSGELRGQIDLPDVTTLGDQDLDRLIVSTIDGDTDGDGDIDVLYSFGSRSFTIFDTAGNVVFDSGDEFEQIVASIAPERFNNDDGDTVGTLDGDGDLIVQNRSDAKGPEPEAIEVGQIGDQTYAFIGLERDSGVMIYNITNPSNARFVDYIDGFGTGNVGPEVIEFIPQAESTSGNAQIAVAYEISGTTAVYDLEFNGLPVTAPAEVIDVTLLYDAALDRTADNEGLNFWIDAVQDGLPIEEAAEFFIESDEFQENFDSSTDEALVTTLYQNVLERDPEPEGFEFWTGVIDEIGQAEALLFFSRSVENVDGTDLTTLVETEPGEWAFFA